MHGRGRRRGRGGALPAPAAGGPGRHAMTLTDGRGGREVGPGPVSENELEDDLRRLIGLFDDAEEAIETAKKDKKGRGRKAKSRKKRGPPACSGAWWTGRKVAVLALVNNLVLLFGGFYAGISIYNIDVVVGELRVEGLRADKIQVLGCAGDDCLANDAVLIRTPGVAAPRVAGSISSVQLVAGSTAEISSREQHRSLTLRSGGTTLEVCRADSADITVRGAALLVNDLTLGTNSIRTTLSELTLATAQNHSLLRVSAQRFVTNSSVLAPESVLVGGVPVFVVPNHSVSIVDAVVSGRVNISTTTNGTSVEAGDLVVQTGVFKFAPLANVSIAGQLTAAGSVQVLPTESAAGEVVCRGALEFLPNQFSRSRIAAAFDLNGTVRSEGRLIVNGQSTLRGDVSLGYGPGSQLRIAAAETTLGRLTTAQFTSLGSRASHEITLLAGLVRFRNQWGIDAVRFEARSGEPHSVYTGGSVDSRSTLICRENVTLGDEIADIIEIMSGEITFSHPSGGQRIGRNLQVDGASSMGSWFADEFTLHGDLQTIRPEWRLTPRLKSVRHEVVTFRAGHQRPGGARLLDFESAVGYGDVNVTGNMTIFGSQHFRDTLGVGGNASFDGDFHTPANLKTLGGFTAGGGKRAYLRGGVSWVTGAGANVTVAIDSTCGNATLGGLNVTGSTVIYGQARIMSNLTVELNESTAAELARTYLTTHACSVGQSAYIGRDVVVARSADMEQDVTVLQSAKFFSDFNTRNVLLANGTGWDIQNITVTGMLLMGVNGTQQFALDSTGFIRIRGGVSVSKYPGMRLVSVRGDVDLGGITVALADDRRLLGADDDLQIHNTSFNASVLWKANVTVGAPISILGTLQTGGSNLTHSLNLTGSLTVPAPLRAVDGSIEEVGRLVTVQPYFQISSANISDPIFTIDATQAVSHLKIVGAASFGGSLNSSGLSTDLLEIRGHDGMPPPGAGHLSIDVVRVRSDGPNASVTVHEGGRTALVVRDGGIVSIGVREMRAHDVNVGVTVESVQIRDGQMVQVGGNGTGRNSDALTLIASYSGESRPDNVSVGRRRLAVDRILVNDAMESLQNMRDTFSFPRARPCSAAFIDSAEMVLPDLSYIAHAVIATDTESRRRLQFDSSSHNATISGSGSGSGSGSASGSWMADSSSSSDGSSSGGAQLAVLSATMITSGSVSKTAFVSAIAELIGIEPKNINLTSFRQTVRLQLGLPFPISAFDAEAESEGVTGMDRQEQVHSGLAIVVNGLQSAVLSNLTGQQDAVTTFLTFDAVIDRDSTPQLMGASFLEHLQSQIFASGSSIDDYNAPESTISVLNVSCDLTYTVKAFSQLSASDIANLLADESQLVEALNVHGAHVASAWSQIVVLVPLDFHGHGSTDGRADDGVHSDDDSILQLLNGTRLLNETGLMLRVQLSFDASIDDLQPGTVAREAFEFAFKTGIVSVLNVTGLSVSDVVIDGIVGGSIVVTFHIETAGDVMMPIRDAVDSLISSGDTVVVHTTDASGSAVVYSASSASMSYAITIALERVEEEEAEREDPVGSVLTFRQYFQYGADLITWERDDCRSNPCLNGATCYDKEDAFVCDCAPGWEGAVCDYNRGLPCVPHENECQKPFIAPAGMPSNMGARCIVNGPGDRQCACYLGYLDVYGNGTVCVDIDECLSAPCMNGGKCINEQAVYVCVCAVGFQGAECRTPLDAVAGKIVDRASPMLLAAQNGSANASNFSNEFVFYTTAASKGNGLVKISDEGYLDVGAGNIKLKPDSASFGNVFVSAESQASAITVVSTHDAATMSVQSAGDHGASIVFSRQHLTTGPSASVEELSRFSLTNQAVASAPATFAIASDNNSFFEITSKDTVGDFQDTMGDLTQNGAVTAGKVLDFDLVYDAQPVRQTLVGGPGATIFFNRAVSTENYGEVSGSKMYLRTIEQDCIIRGIDRADDTDIIRAADRFCTVGFDDYLLPGETVRNVTVSLLTRGDFNQAGEHITSLTMDGAEVSSSCAPGYMHGPDLVRSSCKSATFDKCFDLTENQIDADNVNVLAMAGDGAVEARLHVSPNVNYCDVAAHAIVRLEVEVIGADHCASNPCLSSPLPGQDFICYNLLEEYVCLPPTAVSVLSDVESKVDISSQANTTLRVVAGFDKDPKVVFLDAFVPGSTYDGFTMFLDGRQNGQECVDDAPAADCTFLLSVVTSTLQTEDPCASEFGAWNSGRPPSYYGANPYLGQLTENCAWTCTSYPHCKTNMCADYADCACGYCDSGNSPSLRWGREQDTSLPASLSVVDIGSHGSALVGGDVQIGAPTDPHPRQLTVRSPVSAHLNSLSLFNDSFIEVTSGLNGMAAVVVGDHTLPESMLLYNHGSPQTSCFQWEGSDPVCPHHDRPTLIASDGARNTLLEVVSYPVGQGFFRVGGHAAFGTWSTGPRTVKVQADEAEIRLLSNTTDSSVVIYSTLRPVLALEEAGGGRFYIMNEATAARPTLALSAEDDTVVTVEQVSTTVPSPETTSLFTMNGNTSFGNSSHPPRMLVVESSYTAELSVISDQQNAHAVVVCGDDQRSIVRFVDAGGNDISIVSQRMYSLGNDTSVQDWVNGTDVQRWDLAQTPGVAYRTIGFFAGEVAVATLVYQRKSGLLLIQGNATFGDTAADQDITLSVDSQQRADFHLSSAVDGVVNVISSVRPRVVFGNMSDVTYMQLTIDPSAPTQTFIVRDADSLDPLVSLSAGYGSLSHLGYLFVSGNGAVGGPVSKNGTNKMSVSSTDSRVRLRLKSGFFADAAFRLGGESRFAAKVTIETAQGNETTNSSAVFTLQAAWAAYNTSAPWSPYIDSMTSSTPTGLGDFISVVGKEAGLLDLYRRPSLGPFSTVGDLFVTRHGMFGTLDDGSRAPGESHAIVVQSQDVAAVEILTGPASDGAIRVIAGPYRDAKLTLTATTVNGTNVTVSNFTLRKEVQCPTYAVVLNNQIIGYNTETVGPDVTVRECELACCGRDWCMTFDYNRLTSECHLSEKTGDEVGLHSFLATTYDHYIKAWGSSRMHIETDRIIATITVATNMTEVDGSLFVGSNLTSSSSLTVSSNGSNVMIQSSSNSSMLAVSATSQQRAVLALNDTDSAGWEISKTGRQGCFTGWFECDDGVCINSSAVCDGVVELDLNTTLFGEGVDCADRSDEGWNVCAGYGAYTADALNATNASASLADFGVLRSPFAPRSRSDHPRLDITDGNLALASLYWNPDVDQQLFRISRHVTAAGFLSKTTSEAGQKQFFTLGSDLADPISLNLRVGQSQILLTPRASDRENCTVEYCNDITLEIPDPVNDGTGRTYEPANFTTITFKNRTGRVLTAASTVSTLTSIGELRIGNISSTFGNITATEMETSADVSCGSDATVHGAMVLESALTILNGEPSKKLGFNGMIRSQIIMAAALATNHSTSQLYPNVNYPSYPLHGHYIGASLVAHDFTIIMLNEDLVVIVDGTPQTVVLSTNIRNAADVVTALAGLTGAVATEDGTGNVMITSDTTGTASAIDIDPSSGASALALFGAGVPVAGNKDPCVPTAPQATGCTCVPGDCTLQVDSEHLVALPELNKVGYRNSDGAGGWNKQYWLVPLFDPISATSLGGSRELFLNDIGPGTGSVLWVGKPLGGPEHIVPPATSLVSAHTAGVFENDGTTLVAGASIVVTIENILIKSDSIVFATIVDDTYGGGWLRRPAATSARAALSTHTEVRTGFVDVVVSNIDSIDCEATPAGYSFKLAWVLLM